MDRTAVFPAPPHAGENVEGSHGTWLAPLLVLTLLAIVLVLVAGPIKQAAAADGPQELPQDFQYWSPEQQQMFMQSSSQSQGPVFVYVFPAVTALLKIWVGWFLLAAVLHLALTLSGSRSSLTTVLNLVAWASLPIAVRFLVQIGGLLMTHQPITHPGLSGFAVSEGGALVRYIGAILPLIDLYLVWMIGLIVAGLRPLSGMTLAKIWICVLVSLLIVLVLEALPGFLGTQFGGMGTHDPAVRVLMDSQPFIQVRGLRKSYPMGSTVVHALAGVDLTVERNSLSVVMGPSGSGKSTLLYLLGGLDRPTSGQIAINGSMLESLDENALALYRRRSVGFIFQSFNLVPSMTALENVAFPMRFAGISPGSARRAPSRFSNRSVWKSAPTTAPPSCLAASSSASRSPGLWSTTRT